MKSFAFITRHQPTTEQLELAKEKGIVLHMIGDMDAFTVKPSDVQEKGNFDGVVVVHPAMALRLAAHYTIAVFENGNRASEDGKPQFYAKALHLYDL